MAPLIAAAVPVPLIVLAVPPAGVAVTVNRLPAGAELVSRSSSNVTDSAVPFATALEKAGAVDVASTVTLSTCRPEKFRTPRPAASRNGLLAGLA